MGTTNIEMFAGNTKRIIVTVKDENGNILDVSTALAVTFKVVEAPNGRANYHSTVQISKSIGSGIDMTDGLNGIIKVLISPSDTTALKGMFFYEFKLTDSNNDVATLANGLLTIKESVG